MHADTLSVILKSNQIKPVARFCFKYYNPQCYFVIKVLLYYFFLCDQFKNTLKTDLMQSVKIEVERVWQMSGIKTMTRQNMYKKLLKLVEKYQAIKKDSLKTRMTEPFQKKSGETLSTRPSTAQRRMRVEKEQTSGRGRQAGRY